MAIFTDSCLADAIVIGIGIVVSIVLYFKWAFKYWESRGVVTPPPIIPYGNAKDFIFQKSCIGVAFADIYFQLKKSGARYGGCYILHKPVFIPLDLDLIKLILVKDFDHFTDHGNFVDEHLDPLSGNLFSLGGEKWKKLRVKLTPTFTSSKMKLMYNTVLNCSVGLKTLLEEAERAHEPLDVKNVVSRYTTDVIGNCAFGLDCNSVKDPNSEFRTYGNKVFELTWRRSVKDFVALVMPELLQLLRIPENDNDVTKFFIDLVNQTVQYREQNNVVRNDFLHLLIQLKNNVKISDIANENAQLTDKNSNANQSMTMLELAAQIFIFFLAGYETSSTTTTFLMYELSINQDIQDQVREEIHRVLEKYGGKVTYDGIMELTYLDQCMSETLRKYPPLPVIPRGCTKEYKVPDSNLVLKKGTIINLPLLGIQRDPDYYDDPETFDPDRFTNENKAKRHPCTWFPFGEGPRACIGLRFGKMQAKVALVTLLKDNKFTLNSKTKSPIQFDPKSLMLTALGDVWLNVEKLS